MYEANKKIEQYALRKKSLSQELKGNTDFLKAELGKHYNSKSLERISSNPETIIRLHALNKEGKATGNIQKDISQLHEDHMRTKVNTSNQTPNQHVEKQYMSHVTDGLLQSLDEIKRANEENQKAKSEPTTKRKRRKHHQKDFEQEL
ncbi:hypothetical protein [Virgibacillus salexigens]|uniref:Uncharacterized protein n=1 Tax=Virgibacillus kapii TaxID=1638645 RepID=A0ABQ2DXI4_9BACI|nr:hypothetical protein [Virgibacillus kapii]GGJ75492.1 hypothetical protein GCM10007111_41300 [Virgibacillus kapii]